MRIEASRYGSGRGLSGPDRRMSRVAYEDNRRDAKPVTSYMRSCRSSVEITHCRSVAEAIGNTSTAFDAVISDLNLPDSQGAQTITILSALFADTCARLDRLRLCSGWLTVCLRGSSRAALHEKGTDHAVAFICDWRDTVTGIVEIARTTIV